MGFYIEAPTRKYRKDNRLTIILIKRSTFCLFSEERELLR